MNIWEISTRLGLVRTCGHLGPSHVRTVIPLDEATQADFLARAEAEEWSVAKLQDMKESEARRGDGGSAPPATRFVRRIERVADEFDRIFSDLEDFQGLPRQQAEELHKALYRARERIDRRLARVQRALSPKRAAVRCGEAPAKARHGSGPPPAHPLTMALDGAATH